MILPVVYHTSLFIFIFSLSMCPVFSCVLYKIYIYSTLISSQGHHQCYHIEYQTNQFHVPKFIMIFRHFHSSKTFIQNKIVVSDPALMTEHDVAKRGIDSSVSLTQSLCLFLIVCAIDRDCLKALWLARLATQADSSQTITKKLSIRSAGWLR